MKSKRNVILVNLSIVFFTIVFLMACSKHEIAPNDPMKIGTTEDSVPTPSPQDSLPPIHPQDSIPPTFDRTTVSILGFNSLSTADRPMKEDIGRATRSRACC